jgi:hypothetical protein
MAQANEAYALVEGEFVKIADDWAALSDEEKAALFEVVDAGTPETVGGLVALGKTKVYQYGDSDGQPPPIALAAVPRAKTVLPEGLIPTVAFESVNGITFTGTFAADSGGFVKFAFTADNETYKVWDGAAWQPLALTDFAAGGMTAAEVHALDAAAFAALLDGAEGFGTGIYISQETVADNLNVDALTVSADMKGSWTGAVHGQEFTYSFYGAGTMAVTLAAAGTYKINYDKGGQP